MAKKYNYNPELELYKVMKLPVNKTLLPAIQLGIGTLYHLQKDTKNLKVDKFHVTADDGYEIPVAVFTPRTCAPGRPCLLFLHGGGFVYNTCPHHFSLIRNLAQRLNMKVFLVDYRLAPKYLFPTAHDDCFTVYRYLLENSEELGINKEKIALIGDSAGGNLCASLSHYARDEKLQMPCCQVLLYPFFGRYKDCESMQTFTDTPMCNSKLSDQFNEAYFPFETHERLTCFSPIEDSDFTRLPPTYIETAEYDCLKDTGKHYGELLKKAGTETVYTEIPAAMHGYDIASGSKLVDSLINARVEYIRKHI